MKVLIIEDDPFIGLNLEWIVEAEGHEVVGIFSSTCSARDQLDRDFDYALLDVDVIGGKTFDIALELQRRGTLFAFVSASDPGELPAPLSAASFISKPFADAAILELLKKASPAHGNWSSLDSH
ncbi:hypothetical protein AB4072_09045 [Microvirga sp. 2MCAF38]|uniref:hypothetical protein n=1 Tax=Microvirga sp. 2MCAF38 TaxID=3232989 RepID=UPI003F9A1DC9